MVRYALAASQVLCLIFLLRAYPRRYILTACYLLAVIPVTLLFRADADWLRSWYQFLVTPVAFLRFAAGIEIAHRQTEGFQYWGRLVGSAFLIATMFSGIAWVHSENPDALRSFVELRRLLQIFMAGMFLFLEAFWLSQGGGWYRRADRIAMAFAFLALNHGAVSVWAGSHRFNREQWFAVQPWSWAFEACCYVALTVLFASAPRSSLSIASSPSDPCDPADG